MSRNGWDQMKLSNYRSNSQWILSKTLSDKTDRTGSKVITRCVSSNTTFL